MRKRNLNYKFENFEVNSNNKKVYQSLKDEDETFKEFYESKAKMFTSDFKNYVEGTAKLQYEFLTGREKQSEITDYSSNE